MIPEPLIIPALVFAATVGGIKVGLNGTKERTKRIEDKVDNIGTRVARIEGHLGVESANSGD
jgi:hypothetical protein